MDVPEGFCFESTKTYTHSVGLSCAFRQWRATSHCRFIHGYALKVKIVFGCSSLDQNNWCVDFGSLKGLKAWLEDQFDHKLLVARDDPQLYLCEELNALGFAQIRVVDSVGIEAFAKHIFHYADLHVQVIGGLVSPYTRSVWVESVEVAEHEANSAIYRRKTVA